MSASSILAAWVATHFTGLGARLFRNNVGEAWMGKAEHRPDGAVIIKAPSRVKYGLAVGSSDHVGWTPVVLPPTYSESQLREAWMAGVNAAHADPTFAVSDFNRFLSCHAPEYPSRHLAVFTAVEEKTLAYYTLTGEQRNWLNQVTAAGGLGYVARETKYGPLLNRWPEPTTRREKK